MSSRKYAVIGTGKTGSSAAALLGEDAVMFNRNNPPESGLLSGLDVAIVFVPGSAAEQVMEPLLKSGIPAVWGTTGYEWPVDLSDRLVDRGVSWVTGSNFSMAMNLIRKSIEILGKGSAVIPETQFHIHEIHHTEKVDAPSGTAFSWSEWLGKECEITSEREGDVKGIHSLHMQTPTESVWIRHEAHSRALFAEGAIWSANYLLDQPDTKPGLYTFSQLFDKAFSNLL